MRGKKPFKLAVWILGATGVATLLWFLGLKNDPFFGNLLRKFVFYTFMLLLIMTIIAYINWSEAKRLV